MLIPRQRANLYNGRGGEWAIRGTGLLRQIRNGNLPITAMRDVKFCYLQSIRNYSQSIEIDSNDAAVYYSRGVIFRLIGDYFTSAYYQAIQDLNRALSLGFDSHDVYRHLSEIYTQT
jgi:tetratricopeptide (TPR) repeat protein